MDVYPERVRSWIKEKGGLTPKMMVLSGSELTAMYRPCDAQEQAKDAPKRPAPSAGDKAGTASMSSPPSAATRAMAQ